MTSSQIIGPGSERKKIKIYNSPADYFNSEEFKEDQKLKEDQTHSNLDSIIDHGAYWEIPNITYYGIPGRVHLLKDFLDNKKSKSQSDWVKYSDDARNAGEFYVPDLPLFFKTLQGVYNLRSDFFAEQIKDIIHGFSKMTFIMTLTQIEYYPSRTDTIVHNCGTGITCEVNHECTGPDGIIPAKSPISLYRELFDTKSPISEITSIFKWLCKSDLYFYRLRSKPIKPDTRTVGFVDDFNSAKFYCNLLSILLPSLGLRFIKNSEDTK